MNRESDTQARSTSEWIRIVASTMPARLRLALVVILSLNTAFAEETYVEPPITEEDRDHWAFQPLAEVEVPTPSFPEWQRNEIDAFIAKRLKSEGLVPQPAATTQHLSRRLAFNLIGLPASAVEHDDLLDENKDEYIPKLIDRLLESPHHGERWAQHWLDLARFAETDGFEHDKLRPEAWKYRDWVIKALNDDMPYDEFLRQQIAGDELYPNNEDAITATRFCLSGPDMPDINLIEERRHTLLNEITSTIGEVILGLQLGCAQCHDHKYDAISQADFYRMRAFFEPSLPLKKNKSVSVLKEQPEFKQTSHVMLRGDFRSPGWTVSPGVVRLVDYDNSLQIKPLEHTAGLRTALANWITSPRNPLTARVIVNRVWQQHFGTGLVDTPGDFGVMGSWPEHQELHDWLSRWFVDNGWRLKKLHRLIVTSATYQQRSLLPENASSAERRQWVQSLKSDPDCRLLSRFPRRRLEGEVIRDSMLYAAGILNTKMGGPGVRPPLPSEIVGTLLKKQWEVTEDQSEHNRRSIYVFARRNLRFPIFEAFDRPSANSSCSVRQVSTTAPQSLYLLNSEFTLKIAQQTAADCVADDSGMHSVFKTILGRSPTASELAEINNFMQRQSATAETKNKVLTQLCLTLFNSNEFIFVD